jgi:hypothetical protein
MTPTERRRAPRIDDEGLSLKVKGGDFDIITHTLNISASGIYCKVEKEIPLMSRVQLMLMIPDPAKDDKSSVGVEVDGVVVRQHPVIIEGRVKHYDIAIFFENLSPKHREMISSYIARKKGQP